MLVHSPRLHVRSVSVVAWMDLLLYSILPRQCQVRVAIAIIHPYAVLLPLVDV